MVIFQTLPSTRTLEPWMGYTLSKWFGKEEKMGHFHPKKRLEEGFQKLPDESQTHLVPVILETNSIQHEMRFAILV